MRRRPFDPEQRTGDRWSSGRRDVGHSADESRVEEGLPLLQDADAVNSIANRHKDTAPAGGSGARFLALRMASRV